MDPLPMDPLPCRCGHPEIDHPRGGPCVGHISFGRPEDADADAVRPRCPCHHHVRPFVQMPVPKPHLPLGKRVA